MNKNCTRCGCYKTEANTRLRKQGNSTYLNATCKSCDNEIQRSYYEKVKDNPEFKEKNRLRGKVYLNKNIEKVRAIRKSAEYIKKHNQWELNRYHKVKDVVSIKMKTKRQTPEYKEMMRKYRMKNKEKIKQQEVITKKRYQEKHRDNLTDEYIIRLLINQDVADRETLTMHPEIIEAKRLQLLIIRKTKKNGN